MRIVIALIYFFLFQSVVVAQDAALKISKEGAPSGNNRIYAATVSLKDVNADQFKCIWLLMEEKRARVIWPQAAGELIFDWGDKSITIRQSVSKVSSFPLMTYIVGFQDDDGCRIIQALLNGRGDTYISRDAHPQNHKKMRKARISNVCELENFASGNVVSRSNGQEC